MTTPILSPIEDLKQCWTKFAIKLGAANGPTIVQECFMIVLEECISDDRNKDYLPFFTELRGAKIFDPDQRVIAACVTFIVGALAQNTIQDQPPFPLITKIVEHVAKTNQSVLADPAFNSEIHNELAVISPGAEKFANLMTDDLFNYLFRLIAYTSHLLSVKKTPQKLN